MLQPNFRDGLYIEAPMLGASFHSRWIPTGPTAIPLASCETCVNSTKTCTCQVQGPGRRHVVVSVSSWRGTHKVIIHFERWDFPWTKQLLETSIYGNPHMNGLILL